MMERELEGDEPLMAEEEVGRCEQCGEDCDADEAYCSDDCERAYERDASGADEEPYCDHPPGAWRSCFECSAAYGDLQYQRMKEGDL